MLWTLRDWTRGVLLGAALGASVSACADDPCSGGRCADVTTDRTPPRDGPTADRTPPADASPDADPPQDVPVPQPDVIDDRPGAVSTLEIAPREPVVDVVDTTPAGVMFTATARAPDGSAVTLTPGRVRFTLSEPALGTLDGTSGAFGAVGVGGVARVRVELTDDARVFAETALTVRVRRTVLGPGVPTDAPTRFGDVPRLDPAALRVVYPLAGAVMPRNVFAPNVQWAVSGASPATAGDLYRVRFTRPNITVDAYLVHGAGAFGFNLLPDAPLWRAIAESDAGSPLAISVARLAVAADPGDPDAGTDASADGGGGGSTSNAVRGEDITVRIADAVTGGSIWYWQLPSDFGGGPGDTARVVRLDPTTATLTDPLPAGQCHGCHTVSRDGRLMENNEGSFDLSTSPVTLRRSGSPSAPDGRSFNPDGTRIIQTGLQLLDATTGSPIAATGLPTNGQYPEWSPDGRNVVYATGGGGRGPGVPGGGASNLMLLPVDLSRVDTFTTPRVLHEGSLMDADGPVDWHPTWAPDSRFIVFQNGNAAGSSGAGALWMIPRDTSGAIVRLDRANGGAGTNNSYRPHFSPFNSGGYFWVVFSSRRGYGNAQSGVPAGVRNQLWVAAIRNRPDGRTDPSEVPYWLSGQRTGGSNLASYWAPPPCRRDGTGCATGADCCSGECEPDGMSAPTCRPRRGRCHTRGESCSSGRDCCTTPVPLICTEGRVCDIPPPG